uniref:Uncharacterized protein n=1 Tax=Anguilla anguilla TaxID=7936 RepID=A0A0E9PBP3_ANGAN
MESENTQESIMPLCCTIRSCGDEGNILFLLQPNSVPCRECHFNCKRASPSYILVTFKLNKIILLLWVITCSSFRCL